MDSKDGERLSCETAGSVSRLLTSRDLFPTIDVVHMALDAILGACDVEGNFLVIKVSGPGGCMRPLSCANGRDLDLGVSIYGPIVMYAARCVGIFVVSRFLGN